MRPISWKLPAGILVVLSAHAWSQTPVASKNSPALTGTRQGEARRKALLGAIEDWKTFLPQNQEDPLAIKYLTPLHKIKQKAEDLKDREPVEPVEKEFEDWKQALGTELYEQNKERFFNDPERFSEVMQERLDILTAIRNKKAGAPKQIKHLESLKAQVNGLPDRDVLDRIYNGLGASRISRASSPIRLVSFTGPQPEAVMKFAPQASASAPVALDRASPPPARFEPASYKSEPATTSTLSRIISTVSNTAKRYANKVADAIVSFSRKLGIDEKLQAAVIWAESCFNPHAVSSAGAMGLGQLMPDTARGLRVSNAYDIDQNMRGSARFLRDRLDHFSDSDDIRYMQGLYAWGRNRVQSGESVETVWKDVFARTPLGVKNAIASYNAGQGAIDYYAHGNYMKLPRSHTAYAERNGVGYWQTIHYVRDVLRHYFDIQLQSPGGSPASPQPSVAV